MSRWAVSNHRLSPVIPAGEMRFCASACPITTSNSLAIRSGFGDLPYGVTVAEVMDRRDKLASGLRGQPLGLPGLRCRVLRHPARAQPVPWLRPGAERP